MHARNHGDLPGHAWSLLQNDRGDVPSTRALTAGNDPPTHRTHRTHGTRPGTVAQTLAKKNTAHLETLGKHCCDDVDPSPAVDVLVGQAKHWHGVLVAFM
jgi:hypothetical protein